MSLQIAKAADGSSFEFIKKEPMSGAIKDVYFSPKRDYVVAFFRNKLDENGTERLQRLVGQYRLGIFGQSGSRFWEDLYRWPEQIVEHDNKTGIVIPVYQPKYFFAAGTDLEGVEKQGKWFTSAKNFNKYIPDQSRGDLLGFIQICMNLSRAVRRLHAAGLAHSDLSYKNCLVDPTTGSACIIDIDGLVVPGLFPPDVLGTPDFIAPEVVATSRLSKEDPNRKFPCRETDQHALAVLIYQYIFHRHPLRGKKVYSKDTVEQEFLEMGEKALFVENAADNSNRIQVQANDKDFLPWIDTGKLPYTVVGPYLKELFEQAFVSGLHNPPERPSADDWEEALVKTTDLLQKCPNPNCVKKWYIFDKQRKISKCPYCGESISGTVPVLDFFSTHDGQNYRKENSYLVVLSGNYFYPWHVYRTIFPNEKLNEEDKKPVGYFSFYNNKWLFVNLTLATMYVIKTNDVREQIKPNQAVELVHDYRLLFSVEKTGRLARVSLYNV
jgi:serine/threonine protein kinase